VQPPESSGRERELVPIPAFHPQEIVPVPAPTDPSSTGPPSAPSIASRILSAVKARLSIAFRNPSFVSPTIGLIERADPFPRWARVQSMIASARPRGRPGPYPRGCFQDGG